MKHTALIVTVVVGLALCEAVPTTAPIAEVPASLTDEETAEAFLENNFSTNSSTRRLSDEPVEQPSFETKLKVMQDFYGLVVTGRLDSNTIEVMKAPRCGVPDVPARYGHFQGRPKWKHKLVTYRITAYTPDLSRREVDATIAKAFQLYSDVIPLDFKQIYSGTADIMILFNARAHGDFWPFDGPNGVLAHAMSPGEGTGGDTHFDEDERWTLSSSGVNLMLVAAHEFGHALGLDHSRDRSALMFPTYKYVNTNGYHLPRDDTNGVQALYGVRQSPGKPQPRPDPKPDPKPPPRPDPKPRPRPKPTPDPRPGPPPERCNRDLVFDAATSIKGELFFFKNGYYWKKGGYYQRIQQQTVRSTWSSISSVDAAYEIKSRDIAFLFRGREYWGIRGTTTLPGYPKPISNFGFPSSVRRIDSAVHVASTRRTLFFVRNKFWSFDETRGRMDSGYPRLITQEFRGIGSRVDAAFENYGYLYFSNGARQTEYHYESRRIVRTLLNYGWLNCY